MADAIATSNSKTNILKNAEEYLVWILGRIKALVVRSEKNKWI